MGMGSCHVCYCWDRVAYLCLQPLLDWAQSHKFFGRGGLYSYVLLYLAHIHLWSVSSESAVVERPDYFLFYAFSYSVLLYSQFWKSDEVRLSEYGLKSLSRLQRYSWGIRLPQYQLSSNQCKSSKRSSASEIRSGTKAWGYSGKGQPRSRHASGGLNWTSTGFQQWHKSVRTSWRI